MDYYQGHPLNSQPSLTPHPVVHILLWCAVVFFFATPHCVPYFPHLSYPNVVIIKWKGSTSKGSSLRHLSTHVLCCLFFVLWTGRTEMSISLPEIKNVYLFIHCSVSVISFDNLFTVLMVAGWLFTRDTYQELRHQVMIRAPKWRKGTGTLCICYVSIQQIQSPLLSGRTVGQCFVRGGMIKIIRDNHNCSWVSKQAIAEWMMSPWG